MEKPEIIYNKYNKNIYNLAYRMTGSIDDASDIVQETFIQAFNSIDKFKGESQIYTWLYQIAKNNCLKFLEKKNKTTSHSIQELIDKVSSPVSEEISELEKTLYISQVKDGCLTGLLCCLSFQQRLTFILHILLDISIEQVAKVIGKSENATRILLHRSRKNIKDFLCSTCSVYDPKNRCRCENLINYSLKQGWINSNSIPNNTLQIEKEIKHIKKEINLYTTLHEAVPSDELNTRIRRLLSVNEDFVIFIDKKVK